MNDDLRRRLESLADRGEPRGADEVLAAARSQVEAAARRQRPTYVAAALAAAVLAVLGTTAVVVHEDGDDQQLAGSAATSTTTTTIAAPALDLTRLTREQRASRLERYASCDAVATRRATRPFSERTSVSGSARRSACRSSTWMRSHAKPMESSERSSPRWSGAAGNDLRADSRMLPARFTPTAL